jgi:hypothetical protein
MGCNVNAEKKRLEWEKQQFVLDKLLNPITFLIGGFVATNLLQNMPVSGMTKTTTQQQANKDNWLGNAWHSIVPWGILIPDTTTTTAGESELTYLTPDQANILRAGMVMLAAEKSGVTDGLGNAAKTLIGALK